MKKIIIVFCIFMMIILSGCDLNPIVNKFNGNDSSESQKQEKALPDGSILYKEATLSKKHCC
ncbi:MAG: hypothetical protein IJO62_00930 [Clostridia bacterium]|nr:hypothetical protein [Clostridia bacterium]